MPELLFELGCEELPASQVTKAVEQLRLGIEKRMQDGQLAFGASVTYCTPRRLIVSFSEIDERQADSSKEVRGPALKAAYDADGNPTQALLGFCRSQSIEPGDLRKEGDYVWFTKTSVGQGAAEVLASWIPEAVRALQFDKTMRWGSGRMRFARPIRWLLAILDGTVIPFEIEGIASNNQSVGHRFKAPSSFQVQSLEHLLKELRTRFVEPDPEVRRSIILDGAKRVAEGNVELSAELVDENVHLTEWPMPSVGQFKDEFLVLPEPVLITAMAKHERFFPVRTAEGKVSTQFVSIRNGGEEETVTRGNAWVLNARFNDAKFFFDEDQRHNLDHFLHQTERIMFQQKLGSVFARTERLARLSRFCGAQLGLTGQELDFCQQAGKYSKADLATGLVSELTSLQGVVGAEYGRLQGLPESVCFAMGAQYEFKKQSLDQPVGLALFIADQADKLVGYLGQGIAPSGSSDPYALRRSANWLVETEWVWDKSLGLRQIFEEALQCYGAQGIELNVDGFWAELETLMSSRYGSLRQEIPHDWMDAAIATDLSPAVLEPLTIQERLNILGHLAEDKEWVQTAIRPFNLLLAYEKKEGRVILAEVEAMHLQSEEGSILLSLVESFDSSGDASQVADRLRLLQAPIHQFFEKTMVMVPEIEVKTARIQLLQKVRSALLVGGDWSKIVIDG